MKKNRLLMLFRPDIWIVGIPGQPPSNISKIIIDYGFFKRRIKL